MCLLLYYIFSFIFFFVFIFFFFFFSSRRRHTRSYGDWSSDVCSSDLSSVSTTIGVRSSIVVGPNLRCPLISEEISENFAPPFPEKKPRDGTQKKVKK